jgi:hypothetical protein
MPPSESERPALFWSAVVCFGLALVPHCGASGYVVAGAVLGEPDHTLEPRLKDVLAHQEHPEARREVEQIRRELRRQRLLSLIELHCGLAGVAHLVGLILIIVGRTRGRGLAIAGAVALAYAPTGVLSANLELVHLPAWAQRLSWLALALLAVALGLLALARRRSAPPTPEREQERGDREER